MPKCLVADCETDGLLDELTKLHCLAYVDTDTGQVHSFADQPGYTPIEVGLREIEEAETTVWHNGIKFDIPAIRKVYPWWKPKGTVRDSMLTASLVYPKNPTLFDIDKKLVAKGRMPRNMMGRHSLQAWGIRVGEWKGDYDGGWECWTPAMHSYCEQDVRATAKVWAKLTAELATWKSQECVDLEHEVAWIIARQERNGVGFDEAAAARLLGQLTQLQEDLKAELGDVFPPQTIRTPFVPKRANKTKGWVAGQTIWKEKVVPFNPASRQQVAARLIEMGWQPTERTDKGAWKIDADILGELPFPEAQKLARLYEVDKRIGTLSTGKQSLMRCCKNGGIHGRCDSNGAVTGRATHSNPNMNLPRVTSAFGKEFRALFVSRLGTLCGTDADSLEARVEAGFTVRYDGGAYREMILNGKKEDGTDLHTTNAKAISKVIDCPRDRAKNTKYAWTYGAGDWKLGFTAGAKGSKEAVSAAGAKIRRMLLAASPGLAGLVDEVGKRLKKRPYLWGLDGRKLVIRSSHAALNTLFQSAGSVVFKKAMVICDAELTGVLPSVIGTQGIEAVTRFVPGKDFEQVLWVHDEVQHDCRLEIAKVVGETMSRAITTAGEHFRFNCPMGGNSDLGPNWSSTH